jgi:hypothetical protein
LPGRERLLRVYSVEKARSALWEFSRHVLLWYFATLSQIGTVYGSLTTAIAVLLSLEVGAGLLLFGAQVISEYERIGAPRSDSRRGFTTDPGQESRCTQVLANMYGKGRIPMHEKADMHSKPARPDQKNNRIPTNGPLCTVLPPSRS